MVHMALSRLFQRHYLESLSIARVTSESDRQCSAISSGCKLYNELDGTPSVKRLCHNNDNLLTSDHPLSQRPGPVYTQIKINKLCNKTHYQRTGALRKTAVITSMEKPLITVIPLPHGTARFDSKG